MSANVTYRRDPLGYELRIYDANPNAGGHSWPDAIEIEESSEGEAIDAARDALETATTGLSASDGYEGGQTLYGQLFQDDALVACFEVVVIEVKGAPKPEVVLGSAGLGSDETEAGYAEWVQYVCEHIDARTGFWTEVDASPFRDGASDRFYGTDEQIETMREAIRSLWDDWCALPRPEGAPATMR